MKKIKTLAIVALLAFSATTITAQSKKIDVAKSKINWVGKKVTGQHEGTVNLKEGVLTFNGKNLMGGSFTVDMNSLVATDLKSGEGKEKLEGHLKSEDFFGTEKHTTSLLVFKTIVAKGKNVYTVTANLTIKEITNPVTFDITVNENTATTAFKVNRTKYNIKYGSGSFFDNLGDKAIYDDFELSASLKF